jgi:hypothetical protein
VEVRCLPQKIPVIVFLAVGVCGCSQTGFLGRIYEAVKKHSNEVDYKEYSAGDKTAAEYGIKYRGVVVGNRLLGTNPTAVEIERAILKELEKLGTDVGTHKEEATAEQSMPEQVDNQ